MTPSVARRVGSDVIQVKRRTRGVRRRRQPLADDLLTAAWNDGDSMVRSYFATIQRYAERSATTERIRWNGVTPYIALIRPNAGKNRPVRDA